MATNETHMGGHGHDGDDGDDGHGMQTDSDKNEHGGHTGGGGHMMHGMSPYLFTRTTDFFILFKEADIQSTGGFVGALLGSFTFALLATLFSLVMHMHEKQVLDKNGNMGMSVVAAVLFGLRQLLHYAAMLIVMTMNVWVILVVVAGHSVGWLVFKIVMASRRHRAGGAGAGADGETATAAAGQKEQGVDTHEL